MTSDPGKELERSGRLIVGIKGTSMLPFLCECRDTVYIERATGRLKRLDVAFYTNGSGAFVLHRIIRVLPDGYDICGDHLFVIEHDVKDKQILGVMTGFFRGGRYISCSQRVFHMLSFMWAALRPVRKCYASARSLSGRLKRRLAKYLNSKS